MLAIGEKDLIEFLKSFFEDHELSVYTHKLNSETNIRTDEVLSDKIANSRLVIFCNIYAIDKYRDFIRAITEKEIGGEPIYVMALSNDPTVDEAYKCMTLGMVDYIILPIQPLDLLQKVEGYVS